MPTAAKCDAASLPQGGTKCVKTCQTPPRTGVPMLTTPLVPRRIVTKRAKPSPAPHVPMRATLAKREPMRVGPHWVARKMCQSVPTPFPNPARRAKFGAWTCLAILARSKNCAAKNFALPYGSSGAALFSLRASSLPHRSTSCIRRIPYCLRHPDDFPKHMCIPGSPDPPTPESEHKDHSR